MNRKTYLDYYRTESTRDWSWEFFYYYHIYSISRTFHQYTLYMSPMLVTSYLFVMLTLPSVFALPQRHQRPRKSCGKELNKRIFYICSNYGGFATFDDSLSATPNRRQKRGIVDECCKRPCIDRDLRQYCNQNFVTKDASSEAVEENTEEQQHKSEPDLNVFFYKALQQQQPVTTTKKIEFGTVAPEFQKAAFINKF